MINRVQIKELPEEQVAKDSNFFFAVQENSTVNKSARKASFQAVQSAILSKAMEHVEYWGNSKHYHGVNPSEAFENLPMQMNDISIDSNRTSVLIGANGDSDTWTKAIAIFYGDDAIYHNIGTRTTIESGLETSKFTWGDWKKIGDCSKEIAALQEQINSLHARLQALEKNANVLALI